MRDSRDTRVVDADVRCIYAHTEMRWQADDRARSSGSSEAKVSALRANRAANRYLKLGTRTGCARPRYGESSIFANCTLLTPLAELKAGQIESPWPDRYRYSAKTPLPDWEATLLGLDDCRGAVLHAQVTAPRHTSSDPCW